MWLVALFFFFQAEDGIRDWSVTGVQTCALPIWQADGRAHGWRGDRLLRRARAACGRSDARVPRPQRYPSGAGRVAVMNQSVDELELKARVDDPAALERAIVDAGGELMFRGEMIDR